MTDLVGGGRTPKSSALVCAYGDIDELSAHLGLLRAMMRPDEETALIEQVQQLLFAVGANITPSQQQSESAAQPRPAPTSPRPAPLQSQSAPPCGSTSSVGQHAPGQMYARAAALMEQHKDGDCQHELQQSDKKYFHWCNAVACCSIVYYYCLRLTPVPSARLLCGAPRRRWRCMCRSRGWQRRWRVSWSAL